MRNSDHTASAPGHQRTNHIQLNLRDIGQLFNTIDPSPFQEKDLDRDAEDFILSWAHEFPIDEPVDLVVHLKTGGETHNARALVTDAIHHYFSYRSRLNKLEFKRLMNQGRTSLLVGMAFLGACLLVSQVLGPETGIFRDFVRQGLTIVGWVAMWRPMEIYLYEWWPLRHRGKIFDKLSRMPVAVKCVKNLGLEYCPNVHVA